MTAVKAEYNNDVKCESGIVQQVRIVTSNTTLSSTSGGRGAQTTGGNDGGHDKILAVDTSSSAITVNLPETANNGRDVGRRYIIVDYLGNSDTNNITINPGTNATISGETSATISSNYTALRIKYIGTETVGETTFYRWVIV